MENFYSDTKLSPVELAKQLKTLKSLTNTQKDFNKVIENFVPNHNKDRINQILLGLEQEDEFALLCRLLETCNSLTRLDQTPIIENKDEKIPDFIASFNPGCSAIGISRDQIGIAFNCFIEVKSCKKKRFIISNNDLRRRRNFARRYNLPLIFAVRFVEFAPSSLWLLIDSAILEKQGRKICVEEFNKHLNHILFDDYFRMPLPNLHAIFYYDSNSGLKGMQHFKYGTLIKIIFLLPDEQIEIPDKDTLLVSLMLSSYKLQTVQVVTKGNITCEVSKFEKQAKNLCNIVPSLNHLLKDKDGNPTFNAARIISKLDSPTDKPTLLTRRMVEYAFAVCNSKKEIFLKFAFEKPDNQYERLIKIKELTRA